MTQLLADTLPATMLGLFVASRSARYA